MTSERPGINPSAKPSGIGCAECLATGGWWLHLVNPRGRTLCFGQFAWRRFAMSPGVSVEARAPNRPVT
jgi:hypothetical protein